jgi:hypothetical protein
MAHLRSRIGKPKRDPRPIEGTKTRFSGLVRGRYAGIALKHSRELIRFEVMRLHKAGQNQRQIARALGIPRTTVENWTTQSKLPVKPTSPYTLPRMLALVTLARRLWQKKFSPDPKKCFWEAVRLTPTMKSASVAVYLSLEAIPALPGYPLYADQSVQARCEALARGERTRGCDLFDEPVVPKAPELRAPTPSGPAPMPLVRGPVVDREKFLLGRSRLQLPRLRL